MADGATAIERAKCGATGGGSAGAGVKHGDPLKLCQRANAAENPTAEGVPWRAGGVGGAVAEMSPLRASAATVER